jgi:hypothetical protein
MVKNGVLTQIMVWWLKTKPSDNYRFVSLPQRGSKSWEKLYNKRTAVERVIHTSGVVYFILVLYIGNKVL